MFSWHVHSAIGRGRPVGKEFGRVADSITASLRAFSASAGRSADNDSTNSSARQRSAVAVKELSSIASAPRTGVDARSLAAKPPASKAPTFTITRYDTDTGPVSPNRRGGFRGVVAAGARGGGSPRRRRESYDDDDDDDGEGRPRRRRGGLRGGSGGRGAKRYSAESVLQETEREEQDPYEIGRKPHEFEAEDDLSDEEEDYINISEGGGMHVWNPETSLENLQRWRPATIQSPMGLMENVRYRLAVATDNQHTQYRPSRDHMIRVKRGLGTLFEDPNQRLLQQKWKDFKDFSNAVDWGKDWYQEDYGELSLAQKDRVMKEWVAGHYEAPKTPEQNQDVLAVVRSYVRRNESFLSSDRQKMEAKLSQILPPQLQGKQPARKNGRARL